MAVNTNSEDRLLGFWSQFSPFSSCRLGHPCLDSGHGRGTSKEILMYTKGLRPAWHGARTKCRWLLSLSPKKGSRVLHKMVEEGAPKC